jgi:hypothetical protein
VLAGLERWKARHADVAPLVEAADVLVDSMRGRFQSWWRIRVNLQHVPEAQRPAQEALDPDDEPKVSWPGMNDPEAVAAWKRSQAAARKARASAKREADGAGVDAAATGAELSGDAASSEGAAGEAASEAAASETSPRRRPSRARKPS